MIWILQAIRKYIVLVMCLASAHACAFDLVFVEASDAVFAQPHDIVLSGDQRYLYVADNNNDRIAVLDADSLKLLGVFGEDDLREPHDVAWQSTDRLLVADTGNNRIAIYQMNGTAARLAGELRGSIRRPEGVTAHPNGRVYATGAGSGNIEAFANGRSVAVAGDLNAPHDVALAADGSLWIADAGNDRLVQLDPALQVQQVLKGAPYHFNGPRYLDFDQSGRLYVADKYNHQIKILAPDNTLLFTLGSGRAGRGPGLFDRPEGIAIHGTDIWFADTYNNRIVRYRRVE